MAIGQSTGLNYEINPFIPQQAAQAPGQPSVGAYQPPGLPDDPLAVKEGYTEDLFGNYALLKSFAEDMARKGIDVFQPDYSQPGGGLPFQTYMKLDAGVRYASNKLRNEQKFQEDYQKLAMENKARLAPGFDQSKEFFTDNPDAVVSTQPTYAERSLNERTAQTYETKGATKEINDQVQAQINIINADESRSDAQKQQDIQNIHRAVTRPTVFNPNTGRGGVQPEDIVGRAEIIRQIKGGITTRDQGALNQLRVATGVEDVMYVDDGERYGIEVFMKGAGPAFIDLSGGRGSEEINSLISKTTGQKKIGNEFLLGINTNVDLPPSNSKQVMDGIKSVAANMIDNGPDSEVFPKLQKLANEGKLYFKDGLITSINHVTPFLPWNDNTIELEYKPIEKGVVQYKKNPKPIIIKSPEELQQLIRENANDIIPEFNSEKELTPEERAVAIKAKYGLK